MADEAFVIGEMAGLDEPVWEPLERAVGEELASTFMCMYEVRTTHGGPLQAYKHIDTRRYLHLDHDGRAYEYLGEQRYRQIPLAEAIDLALRTWERLGATATQMGLVGAAIKRARS